MADFTKNIFQRNDPLNPLPGLLKGQGSATPAALEELRKWQPRYTGWHEGVDFAGRPIQTTAYNAVRGQLVAPTTNAADEYVSATQQVTLDKAKEYAQREIVTAVRNAKGSFQILDPGIRAPLEKFIDNTSLQFPAAPWEFKLEYSALEIKSGRDYLNGILGAIPADFPMQLGPDGNPVLNQAGMVSFAAQAAQQFANTMRPPLDPKVLEVINSNVMGDAYQILQQLPESLHDVTNELMDGVSKLSSLATAEFYGSIDLAAAGQSALLTISALQDGVITKEEAEGIGASGGAFIGGAIGSIYGPLGTLIGSGIGALMGALFGGLLGEEAGMSQEAYDAREAEKVQKDAKRELDQIFRDMRGALQDATWDLQCQKLSDSYYNALAANIRFTARVWAAAEFELGWKFELRWFDPNPGMSFRTLLPKAGSKEHKNAEERCKSKVNRHWYWVKTSDYERLRAPFGKSISSENRTGMRKVFKDAGSTECHIFCPQEYGCPYPNVTGVGTFPVFQGTYYAGTEARVAAVFAARGHVWKPAGERPTCEELREDGASLDVLYSQATTLTAASKLISFDVVHTATAVQVEHDMWANAAMYKLNGMDTGVLGKIVLQKGIKKGTVTPATVTKLAGPEASKQIFTAPEYKKLRTARNINQWMMYGGIAAAGLVTADMMKSKKRNK